MLHDKSLYHPLVFKAQMLPPAARLRPQQVQRMNFGRFLFRRIPIDDADMKELTEAQSLYKSGGFDHYFLDQANMLGTAQKLNDLRGNSKKKVAPVYGSTMRKAEAAKSKIKTARKSRKKSNKDKNHKMLIHGKAN